MPLAVSRSLMGAMISTRAKNLADGPSFADRFYARNGRVWPAPSPVCMLACRESTRLHVPFFFFWEGKRKSPRKPVQLAGANWENTKPRKLLGCTGRIPNSSTMMLPRLPVNSF
jgi:hypothetical protein